MKQITNTVLMIEPVSFKMNEETTDNYFQIKDKASDETIVQTKALHEFKTFVTQLQNIGVKVILLKDNKIPETPDALFPNNWISFHENNTVCMYPMFAKNRRLERRDDVLETVEKSGYKIETVIDYTSAEQDNVFLEGTGSMVLDRPNKIAYCALSTRSNENLFIEFCEDMEYTPIVFRANHIVNGKRKPIYHTNIMMSIGETFAIICLSSISDKKQRKQVLKSLQDSGKEVITISDEQVTHFVGNILQVKGTDGNYIIMSQTAHASLRKAQITLIEKHGKLIISDVTTIEKNGGGSVRCMLAELF